MNTMTWLWIAFVTLISARANANMEMVQRAIDRVDVVMNTTQLVANEMKGLFEHGFVSANMTSNDSANTDRLVFALHALLTPTQAVSFVRVMVDGKYFAFSQHQQRLLTTENSYVHRLNVSSSQIECEFFNNNTSTCWVCLHEFTTHSETVFPLVFVRSIAVNSTDLFLSSNPGWQPITAIPPPTTPASTASIELLSPLHNTQHHQIGNVAVGFAADVLDTQFTNLVWQSEDQRRTVFVLDDLAGTVLGVSGSESCARFENVSGVWERLSGVACASAQVSRFAELLFKLPENLRATNQLLVGSSNSEFAIAVPFTLPNVTWHVIVAGPLTIKADMIATDSELGITFYTVSSVLIVVMLVFAAWAVRFREWQLWKVSQPSLLVVGQFSMISCSSLTFVFVGQPTDAICQLRQWGLLLSGAFFAAALLGRLLHAYINLTQNTYRKREFPVSSTLGLVFAVVLVQFVMVGVWQFKTPSHTTIEFRDSFQTSDVIAYEVCSVDRQGLWYMLTRAYVLIVFLVICIFAYKSRNFSPMFFESRALLTIYLHLLFLATALVLATTVLKASSTTSMIQTLVVIFWVAFSFQTVLFYPRISRQLTKGDLTTAEIKEMVVQHLKLQGRRPGKEEQYSPPHHGGARAVYPGTERPTFVI